MSGMFKPPCRGRKRRTCRKAPKSCMYISSSKRRYCRKRTITRKRR